MKKLLLLLAILAFPIVFFNNYVTAFTANGNNVLLLFIYFMLMILILYYKSLNTKIVLVAGVAASIYAISFAKDIYNWEGNPGNEKYFYEQSFFCTHIFSVKSNCDLKEFKIDHPAAIFSRKNDLKYIKTSSKELEKPVNGIYRISYVHYMDSKGNKIRFNNNTLKYEDGW